MKRLSVVGLVLAGLYTVFVLLALGVFVAFRNEDALASVFLIGAGIPWTLFALDLLDKLPLPIQSEAVKEVMFVVVLLAFCTINALLLYGFGMLIGRLFGGAPKAAPVNDSGDA